MIRKGCAFKDLDYPNEEGGGGIEKLEDDKENFIPSPHKDIILKLIPHRLFHHKTKRMRVLQLQIFHWLLKTLIHIILNSSKILCLALQDGILLHNIVLLLKIPLILKILPLLYNLFILLSIILVRV
jgi:hypothetical protein